MPGPVIRQSNGNGASATSTTITQVLGSAILAGSRLYAYIVWGASTGTVQSVSDTINGTTGWVKVANSNAAESAGPTQGEWWTNPQSKAGAAPTITVTYSVTQTFRAVIFGEITGGDPSDTVLASAKVIGTATTSQVSNSITTKVKNCLVMGSSSNDTNTVVPTAGTGYAIDKTTTTQVIATEWQSQAAAGAITASFTYGTAAAGVVQIVAFLPALPAPSIDIIQRAPDPDFPGDVLFLKSVVVPAAAPSNPLPELASTIVRNLDGDTFPGDVLQLKAPLAPPVVTVALPQDSTFLFLNRGDDSYPGDVLYLHPPVLTSLQLPSTFLFLNRGDDSYPGDVQYFKAPVQPTPIAPLEPTLLFLSRGDDTYAGSVQYFKAPVVQPVVTPSLPVPALFLFLSRGDDSFPGETISMRSIIVPATPPSSILQRRTLHAFGTHAGGRTSRGDN